MMKKFLYPFISRAIYHKWLNYWFNTTIGNSTSILYEILSHSLNIIPKYFGLKFIIRVEIIDSFGLTFTETNRVHLYENIIIYINSYKLCKFPRIFSK